LFSSLKFFVYSIKFLHALKKSWFSILLSKSSSIFLSTFWIFFISLLDRVAHEVSTKRLIIISRKVCSDCFFIKDKIIYNQLNFNQGKAFAKFKTYHFKMAGFFKTSTYPYFSLNMLYRI
ncbi:hypothetical protein DRJ04_06765, partial [Candidatus Aerophobetes bacterium]